MTNPTPLSPAAQTVLAAINSELDHAPWELSYLAGASAAVALRAAAEILREAYANERYPDHPDDFLFDLAAELDGTNNTSENV